MIKKTKSGSTEKKDTAGRAPAEASSKEKALELALSKIEKDFGAGAIVIPKETNNQYPITNDQCPSKGKQ